MKAAAFVLLLFSLIAGCKPRALNDEQVQVEEKLLEISVDTLCHGLETGDTRSVQNMLSPRLDFKFVWGGIAGEAASPDTLLHLLEMARARGYAIAVGERSNLSVHLSRSGDMAGVSFDAPANVTSRDTTTTEPLSVSLLMVMEGGTWKLAQCICATPGTTGEHDAPRRHGTRANR